MTEITTKDTPAADRNLPRYAVVYTPASQTGPGALAVRALSIDHDPRFQDESPAISLKARGDAVAHLRLFLAGLAKGTAWLRRDHNLNMELEQAQAPDGRYVTHYSVSHLKRKPIGWHSIVVSVPNGVGGEVLAELCTGSEDLANALYGALAAGTLEARPVEDADHPRGIIG